MGSSLCGGYGDRMCTGFVLFGKTDHKQGEVTGVGIDLFARKIESAGMESKLRRVESKLSDKLPKLHGGESKLSSRLTKLHRGESKLRRRGTKLRSMESKL